MTQKRGWLLGDRTWDIHDSGEMLGVPIRRCRKAFVAPVDRDGEMMNPAPHAAQGSMREHRPKPERDESMSALRPSSLLVQRLAILGDAQVLEISGLGRPQPLQHRAQQETAKDWHDAGKAEYHGRSGPLSGNVPVICVAELLRRAGRSQVDEGVLVDEVIRRGYCPPKADHKGKDLKRFVRGYVKSALKRGLLVHSS